MATIPLVGQISICAIFEPSSKSVKPFAIIQLQKSSQGRASSGI